MISLDTETTGLDLRHSSRPYFVTICREDGRQEWWEWDVDPLTRKVKAPQGDLDDILSIVLNEELVLQNCRFDVAALASVDPDFGELWPWDRTHDTLIAGHLLASNLPHDLTALALQYLGRDIKPYEDALEKAVQECRRLCRSKLFREYYGVWAIAGKGRPDMPSATEKTWKSDCWLPKAMADAMGYDDDHPYRTVLRDYSNADSASTLFVFKRQRHDLERRGLLKHYEARRKLIPTFYDMERHGLTGSVERHEEQVEDYTRRSEGCRETCVSIAATEYSYTLEMPKSTTNKSLTSFVFDVMKLPVVKASKKTGNASLDANCLQAYEVSLKPGPQLDFVRALAAKRSLDTALTYLRSYERFRLPAKDKAGHEYPGYYRLYPSFNQTGTGTTRQSSERPNAQNVSRKKNFNLRYPLGPLPGREWWFLDYENLELRIPAYGSGEKDLIALFERYDEPPYFGSEHILNFSVVYEDLWQQILDEVGPEKAAEEIKTRWKDTWYRYCKNGDFALQYNCGREKADSTFHKRGCYDKLKARFAKKEALNQKMINMAKRTGYVETMPSKNIDPERGYPLLAKQTFRGGVLPTTPLSYHVQGTAGECIASAMERCHPALRGWTREDPRGYFMMIQVHDELGFDFPKGKTPRSNLPKVMEIRRLMELSGVDISMPLKVSVSYHPNNWGEEEEYDRDYTPRSVVAV